MIFWYFLARHRNTVHSHSNQQKKKKSIKLHAKLKKKHGEKHNILTSRYTHSRTLDSHAENPLARSANMQH